MAPNCAFAQAGDGQKVGTWATVVFGTPTIRLRALAVPWPACVGSSWKWNSGTRALAATLVKVMDADKDVLL